MTRFRQILPVCPGDAWGKRTSGNPIAKEMRKLLDALGFSDNKNFDALRHAFETIGGEAKDQVAVDSVMCHTRNDMASLYRERMSDVRLKAVSEFVRAWLWPAEEKKVEALARAGEAKAAA